MNLSEQQRELLRKIVGVYTSGCYEPFVLVQAPLEETSLLYPDQPAIPVEATKADLLHLRDEGLVDYQPTSNGAFSGKPNAKGILLVQRNFTTEIPTFPNIKPDSIKRSELFVLLSEDIGDENAVNLLMAQMFHTPKADFYLYTRNGVRLSPPLAAALKRGDVLNVLSEYFYFAHPSFKNHFVRIQGAPTGQFRWDWERAVVEKGPEYTRITLKL